MIKVFEALRRVLRNSDTAVEKSSQLVAGNANLADLLNRKLDEVITGSANQTDLLNRKLGELIAGSDNQADLLNRKLGEVIAGSVNQTDLLNRKLDEVIDGSVNQTDLLNRKLGEVIDGSVNRADLISRKLDGLIAGSVNRTDLLGGKLEELIAGSANQTDLTSRKLEELIAGSANQTDLIGRKLEELIVGLAGQTDLLNRKLNQLIENGSSGGAGAATPPPQKGYQPSDPRVMLQLGTFHDARHPDKIRRGVEQALQVRATGGNRAAVAALLAEVGVRVPLGDETYFGEALEYYLGLAYAHMGDRVRAIDHLERSNTLPATGGPAVFEDLVRDSLAIDRLREAAAARGIPTFIISSMPRSASATLTHTLAAMLDIPHVRISLGRFPEQAIVPRWLNAVLPGGAVLHDHFGPTPANIDVLRSAGVGEVFVVVRDPRPAAASLIALERREHPEVRAPVEYAAAVLELYLEGYIPWLTGWLEVARNPASGVKVHWITSTATCSDMAAVWRQICKVLAPRYPALVPYGNAAPPLVIANFVKGDEDAWRELIDEAAQRRMWEALPREALELLNLRP
jgi:hypothetical protein